MKYKVLWIDDDCNTTGRDFIGQAEQDEVDIKKAEIKSARDIGVAYGQNQPKTVIKYNISSWWW